MELHNLKSPSNKKSRTRVGRGPGSGIGKTSKRGSKGQNARSGGGVRPGFEGGQNPLFRRIPKFGFKNINYKKYDIINLNELNVFKNNAIVNAEELYKVGLVKKNCHLIKILGSGKLEKNLIVKAHNFSKTAKEPMKKMGGKIEVI